MTTSTTPTLSLEECDKACVFLIKDVVLNYAKHGLAAKDIGSRVRELGAKLSDSQVYRYLKEFRAEKLLPEKEVSPRTERRRRQMERQNTDRAAVEFVLRADPALTLIQNHLNQLTLEEIQILKKDLNDRIMEAYLY